MPTVMNRLRALLVLAPLLVGGSAPAQAQTLEYLVYLDDERIGETVVTTTPSVRTPDAVELQIHTLIEVEYGGFVVYTFESEESGLVGPDGLIEYSGLMEGDDGTGSSRARRQEGVMHVEVSGLGGPTTMTHPLSAFDFSSHEVPDLTSWEVGTTATYRVLDLETGTIREHSYNVTGTEDRDVGDTTIPCWVVTVTDGSATSRLWLARDGYGTLVREEVSDDDGLQVIALASYGPQRDREAGLR